MSAGGDVAINARGRNQGEGLPKIGGDINIIASKVEGNNVNLIAHNDVNIKASQDVQIMNYGRYGYCRITDFLRREGFGINHKRVERIWKEQGLKVPQKQPKKRHLWLNTIDEYTREYLLSIPKRYGSTWTLLDALSGLFLLRGTPTFVAIMEANLQQINL